MFRCRRIPDSDRKRRLLDRYGDMLSAFRHKVLYRHSDGHLHGYRFVA